MEYLGTHKDRKVYWWSFSDTDFSDLPQKDWICFSIEDGLPANDVFEKFVRGSIQNNILEFKAFGKLSSKLDDAFDETMVVMKVMEGYPEIDVTTTWHDQDGLASSFWECFHATALPETADYDNLRIVCFHFDNISFSEELRSYIKRFNEGWLPSNEE